MGKKLSQKLNWEHVNIGNEFRKIALTYNLKIENFGSVPDLLLRKIDERIQQRLKIEAHKIWDGRLTCYLARNQKEIFKIYCLANPDVRAMRSAKREKVSFEQAKKGIIDRDKEEIEVFRRLYDFSIPYNKKWIDLNLDTSSSSPETLTEIVLKSLKTIERS